MLSRFWSLRYSFDFWFYAFNKNINDWLSISSFIEKIIKRINVIKWNLELKITILITTFKRS